MKYSLMRTLCLFFLCWSTACYAAALIAKEGTLSWILSGIMGLCCGVLGSMRWR